MIAISVLRHERPARASKVWKRLSLTLAAGVSSFSSLAVATTQADTLARPHEARTLRFPADRVMGTLAIQNQNTLQDAGNVAYWFPPGNTYWCPDGGFGWVLLGLASGHVDVPAGSRVMLSANPLMWKNLAPLTKLQPNDLYGLKISYTFLKASPPADADMRYLAGLTGLEVLNLEASHIKGVGLKQLQRLKSLRRIYLPSSLTDAGIEPLAALPSLEAVFFKGSQITDAGFARFASKCPRLKQLALEGRLCMTPAGLAELGKLQNLECLWLSGDGFDDESLAPLRELRFLRVLSVTNATRLSGSGLRYLAGLNRLEILDLTGTQVVDEQLDHLKGLPALKSLGLGRGIGGPPSRISERGIATLADLKTLEYLKLPDKATDAALGNLSSLPNLRGLFFPSSSKNAVTDQGAAYLSQLPKLESVFLADNALTDAGLAELARISTLRKLHGCNLGGVTAAGIARLAASPRLEDLRLFGTASDMSTVNAMSELKHLRRLRLAVSSGSDRLDLGGLSNLEELTISGDFTDADLICIGRLTRLKTLSVNSRGPISGKGLTCLTGLHRLESLSIGALETDDNALKELAHLPRLSSLRLKGKINDRMLEGLESGAGLISVNVQTWGDISGAAQARLRHTLPKLYVLQVQKTAKPKRAGRVPASRAGNSRP